MPAALLAASCGGSAQTQQPNQDTTSQMPAFAKAYEDCWYTGISVNQWEVAAAPDNSNKHGVTGMVSADQTSNWGKMTQTYNWMVAENCMKCEVVHPEENRYDFTLGDEFVNKAKAANMKVLGHCLIWHSQCAKWFHYDSTGNLVDKETLKARMKDHIFTVMDHFRGRVDAWDVCNECFEDDGSFRNSLFYQIMGEEYIEWAFRCAREADSTVQLICNDYNMHKPAKVEAICAYFEKLKAKGVTVDVIGMQGHMILEDGADNLVPMFEHSINCIEKLGSQAAFSEVDLTVLPNPYGFSGANISDRFAYRPEMDPYKDGLSPEKEQEFNDFWIKFYTMLLRHKETVSRVSFWCFNDANSWRNNFPIKGRTDYATMFDRNSNPKPIIQKLIDLRKEQK